MENFDNTGPAKANFHWSGLNETFLCSDLNEVVVAQWAREGFALAKLGGSGGMLPRKIFASIYFTRMAR